MSRLIITIGRQYGSGGKEIGKKLAKRLAIPFYGKEELMKLAKEKSGYEEVSCFYEETSTMKQPAFMRIALIQEEDAEENVPLDRIVSYVKINPVFVGWKMRKFCGSKTLRLYVYFSVMHKNRIK